TAARRAHAVEDVSRRAWGRARSRRFLHRRSPDASGAGPLRRLVCHEAQDPHGGDCRHDLSAGLHLDETDRSERYRCRRRLPARQVAHHPRSGRQRTVQWQLNIRHGLVNARTRTIAVARAITRGAGYRIAGGATETFVTRLAALDLPTAMRESLAPVHQ